jgi:UDP-N-acetylmuramate: L-alanyl-gamma-D-glutamyl-meso-diaminopimelate ligase
MKEISPPASSRNNSAYLIGIGGIGMSALAGLLFQKGYSVSGSDQEIYPPASETLKRLNIPVFTPYRATNVPEKVDLVVVGNSCSRGHPEIELVLERGLRYRSLPEVLKEEFLWERDPLVVAGTHGKTTTSSILAWLLSASQHHPSFFIGGIPGNFPEPFCLDRGTEFVIEGDEYDSAFFDKRPKFLHYCPRGVILGTVEFDHSDIYRNVEDIELAFARLIQLIPRNGILIAFGGNDARIQERVRRLASKAFCPVVTFGFEDGNHWRATKVFPTAQGMEFRLQILGKDQGKYLLSQWGKHNVMNALAALAMAHHRGVSLDELVEALPQFRGVARRMQELGTVNDITFIDDFAHHPTAIQESIAAVRCKYPDRRIIAVFEPRSNTTVRNFFQKEIAEALSKADEVFIGPLHRIDRIPPEERLDIPWIIHTMESAGIRTFYQERFDDLVSLIQSRIHAGDVVLFMSNGVFGGIARRLMAM